MGMSPRGRWCRNIHVESLEPRVLLSSYVLSTLGVFAANTTGSGPIGGVTLDASGDLYGTAQSGGASGDGTVVEVVHGSRTITTLAFFNGANGRGPEGGLVLDGSADLYGTTFLGGGSDDGTIFEIARGSGTITTVASFNFTTNGDRPAGALVLDGSGNLYGTTESGSADGRAGTVFELPAGSGTITTLASFNGTNGSYPQDGVVLDSSGNLYGTTTYGGTSGDGTVFEIAHGSGTITTLASFNGTNGRNPDALILDGSGDLYGATLLGGPAGPYDGDGTIFEIAAGTGTITTLASFNGTNGNGPDSVVLDGSGNLYGTTAVGGTGNFGTVFELPAGSGAITTLASFNRINGSSPYTIVLDGSGSLYGATAGGGDANGDGTVFELSPVQPRLPGDADDDGKVDFADLVILARNYGKNGAVWEDGDFNGDGNVGFDDLVILARNYGKTTPAAVTAAALSPSITLQPSDDSPRLTRTVRHRH